VAIQICMKISSRALSSVIFGSMATAADWADNNILGQIASVNRVTELVTSVTLSNEGKRVKKFGFASSTKHEYRILSNVRKV